MDSGHHTYVEYAPAGVVAAISPWNFPLMMATWKIAPAIAWGNTCVIKPAEDTPTSVVHLGRLAVEAGFPPGVLNVLNGYGVPAGSSLTGTRASTGSPSPASPATGKIIMAVGRVPPRPGLARARRQGRQHRLRRRRPRQRRPLGGRGDLPQRRAGLPRRVAPVRPVGALRRVPRPVQARRRGAAHRRPVRPRRPSSPAWPARSTSGRSRLRRDRRGGGRQGPHRRGRRRRLLGRSGRRSSIDLPLTAPQYCEEIFGPVVRGQPVRERGRGRRASPTTRRTGSTRWCSPRTSRAPTGSPSRLRAGTVWVNCFFIRDLRTPFGGVGDSGVGREGGTFSREFFTEPKAVVMQIDRTVKGTATA